MIAAKCFSSFWSKGGGAVMDNKESCASFFLHGNNDPGFLLFLQSIKEFGWTTPSVDAYIQGWN